MMTNNKTNWRYRNAEGETTSSNIAPTATATTKITDPSAELGLSTASAATPSSYWSMIGGLGGSLYGLLFAFNRGSGFWGYIGWWFLFGTIGSIGGKLVDVTLNKLDA